MEQEMEMTRDELNKMTKRDLIEHLKQHRVKPNRQSILKGRLIDLIIKETNEANEEYDRKVREEIERFDFDFVD